MSKRLWGVTLPIAGHAYLEIEAPDADGAIALAFERVTKNDIEDWDALEQFACGNVLYCPRPWEPSAVDVGEADEP